MSSATVQAGRRGLDGQLAPLRQPGGRPRRSRPSSASPTRRASASWATSCSASSSPRPRPSRSIPNPSWAEYNTGALHRASRRGRTRTRTRRPTSSTGASACWCSRPWRRGRRRREVSSLRRLGFYLAVGVGGADAQLLPAAPDAGRPGLGAVRALPRPAGPGGPAGAARDLRPDRGAAVAASTSPTWGTCCRATSASRWPTSPSPVAAVIGTGLALDRLPRRLGGAHQLRHRHRCSASAAAWWRRGWVDTWLPSLLVFLGRVPLLLAGDGGALRASASAWAGSRSGTPTRTTSPRPSRSPSSPTSPDTPRCRWARWCWPRWAAGCSRCATR